MKKLFLLSGLGADKRVFDFLDLSDFQIHHVVWIKPIVGESMGEYARRLLPQITEANPVLIGISFGGMMAVEISKLIPVEKVIQISSAQTTEAIPVYFRVLAKLNVQKLMPSQALKRPNAMVYWLFGVSTKADRRLLATIMQDTDENFFMWAIGTIILWNNNARLNHVIQIHGTNDRILSPLNADYLVDGGGHLMIVTRAKEISLIIKEILS